MITIEFHAHAIALHPLITQGNCYITTGGHLKVERQLVVGEERKTSTESKR